MSEKSERKKLHQIMTTNFETEILYKLSKSKL